MEQTVCSHQSADGSTWRGVAIPCFVHTLTGLLRRPAWRAPRNDDLFCDCQKLQATPSAEDHALVRDVAIPARLAEQAVGSWQ
jgi:hypothetical protein